MQTYRIVRFYLNERRRIIYTGLTLEEAQAHCNNHTTRGKDWFDGYERE